MKHGKKNVVSSKPLRIGLFHRQGDKITGCWKVVHNLIRGLEGLGVEVLHNEVGDLNGCLQRKAAVDAPDDALLGPEIVVLPSEDPGLYKRFKCWTQPAQWVVDYQTTFPEYNNNRMFVWPSGVDTDRFAPRRYGADRLIEFDCLIYYKNVTKQTPRTLIDAAINKLDSLKQTYRVIEYGSYTEEEFIHSLNSCRYSIWLAGTESQNIAITEAWSMNVPTYIIDQRDFMYGKYLLKGVASSAPYFEPVCGCRAINFASLQSFIDQLGFYEPRSYVLSRFTLRQSALWYAMVLSYCREAHRG